MGFSKQVIVFLGLAVLATQAVMAYDPTITTDFGLTGPGLSGANFTSYTFSKPPEPTTGVTLIPNFVAQFPGLTGLGISSVFFVAAVGGEIPPHTHPRATELFSVLSGTWFVGFIDTNDTLYSADLGPGDQFVFPIGLLHFQLLTSKTSGTAFSAFNSENPGLALTFPSLFESNPSVPDIILSNALDVSQKLIEKIKKKLAS